MAWFSGKDAAVEQAIDRDDVSALRAAVQAGGNVNARGRVGVTPLEYAIGHSKKATYAALLEMKANPNQRDDEQDNAMTLALNMYPRDTSYMEAALAAGGDPNTRNPSNDPLLELLIARSNVQGIRLLHQYHADLNNTQRDGIPMIVNAAQSQYWISVWTLLQLGARYDYSGVHGTVGDGFRHTEIIDPNSERFQARRRCWHFLHDKGVTLPPLDEPLH